MSYSASRLSSLLLCLLIVAPSRSSYGFETTADPKSQELARGILAETGVRGGFIVHLGCGDGQLTAALRQSDSFQVHGLAPDAGQVEKARQNIQALGAYGNVAVDRLLGNHLPYVDNLVNLLIAEDLGDITMEEVQRVLVPNGVAYIKDSSGSWTRSVKPRPATIDDWTHYLHDPSGNAVAHDDLVGPPSHLQWVGSPRWSRHHDRMASMSALVSNNGRMFYIMDEGSRISIQLPAHWKLIARDANNGTILWTRDIDRWQSHLWPLKSGPTQLARRLVAVDDAVYATLSFDAPLTALDAATGETMRTYEGSDATEEIIADAGQLFLVVNKQGPELQDYAPLFGTVGDQKRVATEFFWNEEPRVLMAYEAETGKRLWARSSRIAPLTMAADSNSVYFHDGEKIVAVDRNNGSVRWSTEPASRRRQLTFNFGPRLVIYQDVVLYAGGDNKMTAFAVADGHELWSAQHPNSGYQSPQDLMVVDGLVWCAPTTAGRDTGVFTGRDPKTGEVKREFPPDIDTYWFHHRCYIAKATDNFLIPSRTGIEFVDYKDQHWDINHWVRGGCLYGVMPCNGLLYAPPHDCACYPEAKLFGFNALAAQSSTRPVPGEVPDEGRLEQGPAYGTKVDDPDEAAEAGDWPTYRHDNLRSGSTTSNVASDLSKRWIAELGGRLTPPVIARGQVYVAQIDQHTVHALDASTGAIAWSYTIGARVDSPPTVKRGRVVFGGADGWVYCLRASDGELVWRFRAAPEDRRTMAYEQLESLWPVHGSVLVRGDHVFCVAGRSNFLDGGLRLLQLNLETGAKLAEKILNDRDPETGDDIQDRIQILQMPVGLPDILSSDEKYVYMRSQRFDFDYQRLEIGPVSGDFVKQGSAQTGEGVHLFAPMGFLDDTWFHRSYWVFGKNFAGGHGGYFQAGRFAPSGRILVNGNGYVYGYGRKPEYLRWTTTLEHQLFAAPEEPPGLDNEKTDDAGGLSLVQFRNSPSLNPAGKPLTIEAWINVTKPNGVIVARGGPAEGFALSIEAGKPNFHIRANSELSTVTGPKRIVGGWHHVAGVLAGDKTMRLFVDGQKVAESKAKSLITKDPQQTMEIGADGGGAVGEYRSPNGLTGLVDEVRLYFAAASDDDIRARYAEAAELNAEPALMLSFEFGDGRDDSLNRNDGNAQNAEVVEGKYGQALRFTGAANAGNARQNNSNVKPKWTTDIPIYVRAMALASGKLVMAGPPDIINEEETFERLTESDPEVQKLLAQQDQVLAGSQGGMLMAFDADKGEPVGIAQLDELPVWDGLAIAQNRVFLSTLDGKVVCFGDN